MSEDRLKPSFHKKTKHKKQPTKKHKADKLKALKSQLAFWQRGSKRQAGHTLERVCKAQVEYLEAKIRKLEK